MYLILLAIMLRSAAAICAKQAALTSIDGGLQGIVLNVWLAAELVVLVVQAVVWTAVLRRYPLSVAYPLMSLVFGLNLVAAWLVFGETVAANHVLGIGVIVLGVAIMIPSRDP